MGAPQSLVSFCVTIDRLCPTAGLYILFGLQKNNGAFLDEACNSVIPGSAQIFQMQIEALGQSFGEKSEDQFVPTERKAEIAKLLGKKPTETNEMNLQRRGVFHQILALSESINEATKYTSIHINTKYMKCTYSKEVTEQLQLDLQSFKAVS